MKGIVLAGGHGSRLYPLTLSVSKQILPIYDKPMIFYPLSVLFLAEINEIAIITTPKDLLLYESLLGNGELYGVKFTYIIQDEPKGIAHSLIIAEEFIDNDEVCLILGDNVFFGYNFTDLLIETKQSDFGANIFTTLVSDPSEFAVAEVNDLDDVVSIEEKPRNPKSNYAVTGLYFYDNNAVNIAKSIQPSARGELEITSVNEEYLKLGMLKARFLGRGFAWLDTGNHDSLLSAGEFVKTIEERQGLKIACLEEIAYANGWISIDQLNQSYQRCSNSNYGKYLKKLIDQHR